ncbi:MAG TPA: hypothetical protein VFU85_10835 [Nocardioides sp.]|nr:hypothetical protein [Nocardioides sp.]
MVLVPGTLALLPQYASLDDPVAELRAACRDAVAWLVEAGPVTIVGDPQGRRVGEWLVAEAEQAAGVSRLRRQGAFAPQPPEEGAAVLVVGNGSACRTEKAPGHLDKRAAAFDADLGRRLEDGPSDSLAGIDLELAHELWASVEGIVELAKIPDLSLVQVDYEDDPFGVQYWVVRWASQIP